jgi:hypothetical protein
MYSIYREGTMEDIQYEFIIRIIPDIKPGISETELEHKLSIATYNLDRIVHEKFGKGASILSHNLTRHETTILLAFLIQYSGSEKLQATVSHIQK